MLTEKIPFKSLETSFCLKGFFAVVAVFSSPILFAKRLQTPQAAAGGQSGRGKVLHRALLHVQKPPNGKLRHGNPHTPAVGSRPSEPFLLSPRSTGGGRGTPLKALFSPKTLRRRSSRGGGRLFSIWRTPWAPAPALPTPVGLFFP